MEATDLLSGQGKVRTDLSCTECHRTFIALIDFDVDGNHIVHCPHCQHEHCRVVKNGTVTGDRWDSRYGRVDVPPKCVWKTPDGRMETSSAAAFIRDRWLNFGMS